MSPLFPHSSCDSRKIFFKKSNITTKITRTGVPDMEKDYFFTPARFEKKTILPEKVHNL